MPGNHPVAPIQIGWAASHWPCSGKPAVTTTLKTPDRKLTPALLVMMQVFCSNKQNKGVRL